MTRAEWLSQLKAGEAVLLRTQLRTYPCRVDRNDGERLWVLFALGDALNSATWVDRATGVNPQTHIAILQPQEPEATDAREGVKTGEFGELQADPPTNNCQDSSAPKIADFSWREAS